jgi:hypothetical protein
MSTRFRAHTAMSTVDARYRGAVGAYVAYGVVYLVGGLYLIWQGVGVAGARTEGATTEAMMRWGLIGLVPLVTIPLLLWRPWSFLGGWISRRGFAGIVALFLIARSYKVGEVAVRGGGAVTAPWGGDLGFQAGAVVFLAFTLAALAFLLRAILTPHPRIRRGVISTSS